MIKLEYKAYPEKRTFVLAVETNADQELPVLDFLSQVLASPQSYLIRTGFKNSNRLLVEVQISPEAMADLFSPPAALAPEVPKAR